MCLTGCSRPYLHQQPWHHSLSVQFYTQFYSSYVPEDYQSFWKKCHIWLFLQFECQSSNVVKALTSDQWTHSLTLFTLHLYFDVVRRFWQNAALQGWIFHGGQCDVTPYCGSHTAGVDYSQGTICCDTLLWQSHCRSGFFMEDNVMWHPAVALHCHTAIDNWILLLRTPQQRFKAFQWAAQPPQFPLAMGNLDLISYTVHWAQMRSQLPSGIDWVKALRSTRHKKGHFWDVHISLSVETKPNTTHEATEG